MTIESLRSWDSILLECVSGSRAYGLHTATSDTDIKGVFYLPKEKFYGMEYIKQISNPSNDIVFYELGRFIELLAVNNPNILELLNSPVDSVIESTALIQRIDKTKVLSKLCQKTFGNFAKSQIVKARGLNKKISNPVDKERKTPLDFCYVNHLQGSQHLKSFLAKRNWSQDKCGLSNIPHMRDVYGLYYDTSQAYDGIVKNHQSNELCMSSIPKDTEQIALLYFNKDGYSTYCKDYKEYWKWVDNRNETRFENTKRHGKNYDSKNMMHTFRLLNMAIEIAKEGVINVHRLDRDFLLKVKAGAFEYEDLLIMAEEKSEEMNEAYLKSDLPSRPDEAYLENLLVEMRTELYS